MTQSLAFSFAGGSAGVSPKTIEKQYFFDYDTGGIPLEMTYLPSFMLCCCCKSNASVVVVVVVVVNN